MTDNVKEFTFDLSKITLDEALDILEYDKDNVDPKYILTFVRSIKKTLVRGMDEFTGADLPGVIKAFTDAIMGGGTDSKN